MHHCLCVIHFNLRFIYICEILGFHSSFPKSKLLFCLQNSFFCALHWNVQLDSISNNVCEVCQRNPWDLDLWKAEAELVPFYTETSLNHEVQNPQLEVFLLITRALLWEAEVWCVQTKPLHTLPRKCGDSVSSYRLNWQPGWQHPAHVSNKKQEFSVTNHVDRECSD